MKKAHLLTVLVLSITIISCRKADDKTPEGINTEQSILSNPLLNSMSTLALDASITMDVTGDYIQSPYNTIRNPNSTIMYTTVEQGAGYVGKNPDGSFLTRALIKSTTKRSGTYGLSYDLPKRGTSFTYDQEDRDRLESYILDRVSLTDYSTTAHYSGFSLNIPSGKDTANAWLLIHQWHQSSPESPAIAFELKQGSTSGLRVVVRYGLNKSYCFTQYLVRKDNTSGDDFINLPTDKWIDFVVRWKFDPTGTNGELKVYRHDIDASSSTLIFDYAGQIGYSNPPENPGISEKFGIYRKADYVNSHQIYYDQIKSGTTFNDVKPW